MAFTTRPRVLSVLTLVCGILPSMAIKKQKYLIKTKYGSFYCVFEPEKDMGGYVVEAPDVQGAVSWGKTIMEAKRMIAEAIEGTIETRVISKAVERGTIRIARRTPSVAAV